MNSCRHEHELDELEINEKERNETNVVIDNRGLFTYSSQ